MEKGPPETSGDLEGPAAALSAISDEPFPCPSCGQMLGPTCRVCVVCHQSIDFTQVRRLAASPPPGPLKSVPPQVPSAQFSWSIFLAVLAAWLLAVMLSVRHLSLRQSQWVMGATVLVTSAWVFVDARARSVPHPLRWGVGSLLLWIIIFPWYLSRRRAPNAPCLVMEAESSVFVRVAIWAIVVLFVLGLVGALINSPQR